ncbi:stalk domain-containing protein [Paenibacillus rhizoplanae]
MKKLLLLLFIALLACSSGTALSAAAPAVKITWNGTPITFTGAKPVQEGKTWLIPIRPVSEELGADLQWAANEKEAYPVNFLPERPSWLSAASK